MPFNPEWFTKIKDLFVKKEVKPIVKPPFQANAENPQTAAASSSAETPAGSIHMKAEPFVAKSNFASAEKGVEQNISARIKAEGAVNIPNRRMEILIEEAAQRGEVTMTVQNEVRKIGQLLGEKPSPQQWTDIQQSLNNLSNHTTVDTVEISRFVRKEVSSYAFVRVVQSAEQYGLTTADAGKVAETFRHASVGRYRTEARSSGVPAASSEVQLALERTVVEAELAREWAAIPEIAAAAQQRQGTDELAEKSKKLREAENIEIDEAKTRIRELIKNCSAEDQKWMNAVLDRITVNKDAAAFLLTIAEAGPDALSNPAYLFAKGVQWQVRSFDDLANRPSEVNSHEAAQLQRELVGLITEKNIGPVTHGETVINFTDVDITVINANVRFDGRTMGAGYATPPKEWWMQRRGLGGKHKGFFYGDDPADKIYGVPASTEVQDFLKNVQKTFDASLKGAQDDQIFQFEYDFREIIKDVLAKNGVIDEATRKYQALLSKQVMELRDMQRDHVNLGASAELKTRIWKEGPEEVMNGFLAEAEKYSKSYEGDDIRAANALKHIDQVAAYITDKDLFSSEYRRYQMMLGRDADIVNAEIELIMDKTIPELSNTIDQRRNVLKAYNAYFAVGVTEEKMAQFLSSVGTEAALQLLGFKDGKVATAFDYFDAAVMSEYRALHSDDKRWLSTSELKEVYKRAKAEMMGNDKLGVKGVLSDFEGLKDYEIDEIAFIAQEIHFLFGRPILATGKGFSPIEQGGYSAGSRPDVYHPYADGGGSNLEGYVAARAVIRFRLERWLLTRKGTNGIIEDGAMFAALGAKIDVAVNDIVAEAQSLGKVEDLVRHMCCITDMDMKDPNMGSIVEDKLRRVYTDNDIDGGKRPHPKTLAEAAKNIPLLKEKLMVTHGVKIMESSVMSYSMMDGGAMTGSTITKLHEMFTYADTLAISMQVRDAYAAVLGATDHHAKDHALTALGTVLEKAAKYNSTDLLNAHLDVRDFATEAWFNTLSSADLQSFLNIDEIAAGGITCTGDLVKAISRRDASMESLVKANVRKNIHLGRIDWSQPLSAGHTEVVRQALSSFKKLPSGTMVSDAEVAAYVRIKNSISNHVGNPKQIAKMKQGHYLDFGKQTQNSMDSWMDIAEHPDLYGDKHVTTVPLSVRLGSRSSGDLLVRAHGDTMTACNARDLLSNAVKTQDWKLYMKQIIEIQNTTIFVYGQPWDSRVVMYYTSGLLRGMSQDKLSEWTFGLGSTLRPKDSKLRRLLNSEHAASITIEEKYEMIGELENALMTSLHDVDHELAEVFLQYVGMNFGPGRHLVDNDVLWMKRFYRVAIFGMILLELGALKEGLDEFGKADGGGGGGGGGHAPAHH